MILESNGLFGVGSRLVYSRTGITGTARGWVRIFMGTPTSR